MSSGSEKFYTEGMRRLKEAVTADEAKHYQEALPLYIMGMEHIRTGLKYERNDKIRQSYLGILNMNMTRAEQLKKHNDDVRMGRSTTPAATTAAAGGGSGQATNSGASDSNAAGPDISSMILVESPNVPWSDVIGVDEAKRCLQKSIIAPTKLPHLFAKGGKLKPWSGILLYGPPGTGKTMLARAAATESRCKFLVASCGSIFRKFVGESEQIVSKIYNTARKASPACIVFMDEIESIGRERTSESSETSAKVLTELLTQMDGMQPGSSSSTDAIVLTIAATNYPWQLDGALLRRFTRRIYIPLPDLTGRVGIFTSLIERYKKLDSQVNISSEQILELAQRTDGYSAADIATCFSDSTDKLLDMMLTATHFRLTANGSMVPCSPGAEGAEERSFESIPDSLLPKVDLPPPTFGKLRQALETTRPSVKPETLQQYRDFTAASGMDGQSK